MQTSILFTEMLFYVCPSYFIAMNKTSEAETALLPSTDCVSMPKCHIKNQLIH